MDDALVVPVTAIDAVGPPLLTLDEALFDSSKLRIRYGVLERKLQLKATLRRVITVPNLT